MRSGFLLNANLVDKNDKKKDDNDIFADAPDLGPLRDIRSTFGGRWGKPSIPGRPMDNLGTAQKRWAAALESTTTTNNASSGWESTTPAKKNTNITATTTPSEDDLSSSAGWITPHQAPTALSSSPPKDPWSHITEIPAHVNPSTYYHSTTITAAANNSQTAGKNRPFQSVPLLPKTLGEPKNALASWYGKRHKCVVPKTCFTTWDDGNKSHVRKHTSVFTCPVTQEQFPSGTLRDGIVSSECECSVVGDVVYYNTKKLAEHAASARALDCFSYREHNGAMHYGLCQESPYLPLEAPFQPTKKLRGDVGIIGEGRI